MTFKYLITDLHNGEVVGTNKDEVAIELSFSDDHFVVSLEQKQSWLVEGQEQLIADYEGGEDND